MTELIVLVPTRSRPHNVLPVIEAWMSTGAFSDGGELVFITDADDPRCAEYQQEIAEHDPTNGAAVFNIIQPKWLPLVPKLNAVSLGLALSSDTPQAFMGDDHLPRSHGWVMRFSSTLKEKETGIAYGDDGFQGRRLPTYWAMTPDIVRALGGMVPAPVEHLYCDNAVMVLGQESGCLSYLSDVLIEHMHPVAGKAPVDDQYVTVNSRQRYWEDRALYLAWRSETMASDVEKINALKELRRGE